MWHQHETGNRTGDHLTYSCKYGESRVAKPLYHESYDIHKRQEYVECCVDNHEFIYVADELSRFLLDKEECKLLSEHDGESQSHEGIYDSHLDTRLKPLINTVKTLGTNILTSVRGHGGAHCIERTAHEHGDFASC